MQFDINLTLLKQVEYRISAQLLKLAHQHSDDSMMLSLWRKR